jgi:hypothetical protein
MHTIELRYSRNWGNSMPFLGDSILLTAFPQTRINFYVTIVLTALIPENDRTTELLDGLYKNAVLYGLGLVLTTGIQTLQKQLDMYHAIFVMQIIFSLDFVYAYGAVCVPLMRSFSGR